MTPFPPPAVSVVLPAYNREASIRLAIDSVLRQSFADLELIVVDDASTDGTRTAAEAVPDPRLRVVAHGENQGASAARNTGVAAARAPWVAFQDSDDEWLPLKLEKQMARLTAPRPAGAAGFVAAYCGMIVIGSHLDFTRPVRGSAQTPSSGVEDRARPEGGRIAPALGGGSGAIRGSRPGKNAWDGGNSSPRTRVAYVPRSDVAPVEGDIFESLMRTSLVSTQTLVVRRDLMLQVGGFDPEMPALIDWECMLRLAPLGPVACVDEPLVLQRFSENSITRQAVPRARARARAVAKHRERLARHPEALAGLLYAVAGDLRRIGDRAGAARALAEAAALAPARPKIRAMQAYLALLPLLDRLGVPRV